MHIRERYSTRLSSEALLPETAATYLGLRQEAVKEELQRVLQDKRAGGTPRQQRPPAITVVLAMAYREISRLESLRTSPLGLYNELVRDIRIHGETLKDAQRKLVPMLSEDPRKNPYQNESMVGDRIFINADKIGSTLGAPGEVAQLVREIKADTERGRTLNLMEANWTYITKCQALQVEMGFLPTDVGP